MKKLYEPPSAGLRYLGEGAQLMAESSPDNPIVGWVAIQHGADAPHGSINFLNLRTGENVTHEMPGRPGFFVQTDTPGVVIAGLTDALYLVDFRGPKPVAHRTHHTISAGGKHVINDGWTSSKGIIFGSKATKWLEHDGELYFLPFNNPHLLRVANEIQCSNGIVELKSSEKTLTFAYIDSPKGQVVELTVDYAAGTSNVSRVIADFTSEDAVPDGQRAAPLPGPVRRIVVAFFNPQKATHGIIREIDVVTGETTATWEVPGAARVTCLTFVPGRALGGSKDSVMLVATTADEGMPTEWHSDQPERGCIFIGETHYNASNLQPPQLVPAGIISVC